MVETGIYFSLMNRCSQLGLVNTGGFAIEKDHKKVVAKLSGEKVSAWQTLRALIKDKTG
jgi:hypothetical protein